MRKPTGITFVCSYINKPLYRRSQLLQLRHHFRVLRQLIACAGAVGFVEHHIPGQKFSHAFKLLADQLILNAVRRCAADDDRSHLFLLQLHAPAITFVDDQLRLRRDAPPVHRRCEEDHIRFRQLVDGRIGIVPIDASLMALARVAALAWSDLQLVRRDHFHLVLA